MSYGNSIVSELKKKHFLCLFNVHMSFFVVFHFTINKWNGLFMTSNSLFAHLFNRGVRNMPTTLRWWKPCERLEVELQPIIHSWYFKPKYRKLFGKPAACTTFLVDTQRFMQYAEVFSITVVRYRQPASEMATPNIFFSPCMENLCFTCSMSKWNDIKCIMLTKGWKLIDIQNRNMRAHITASNQYFSWNARIYMWNI